MMGESGENDQPFVSVITPAYNSERFIEDAIQSVRKQTYTNWEMIIVDDCSTDRTRGIVESYLEKDHRLRLIRLENNSGPGIARNTAIAQARGRYLAFLDADDQWLPEKLEKQLQFMQHHHVAFSFTKYIKIKEDNTELRAVHIPERVTYKQLLKHNVIGCLTVMLDTEMIGEVRMIDLRSRQDYALWLTLCKKGFTAYGLQEVLAKYRVVGNSVSSNKLKMAKQNWKIYRDVKKLGMVKSIWYFLNYVFFSIARRIQL